MIPLHLIPIRSTILTDIKPKQYNSVLKLLRAYSNSARDTKMKQHSCCQAHNLPSPHNLFYSFSTPTLISLRKPKEGCRIPIVSLPLANPINVTFILVSEQYNPFSMIQKDHREYAFSCFKEWFIILNTNKLVSKSYVVLINF